jgi:hypothetical protein
MGNARSAWTLLNRLIKDGILEILPGTENKKAYLRINFSVCSIRLLIHWLT